MPAVDIDLPAGISIHAPLTGSDSQVRGVKNDQFISIHAPLTGSDTPKVTVKEKHKNFNPRSPYGERRFSGGNSFDRLNFNPRSPYGERQNSSGCQSLLFLFQSTLPLRGATVARRIGHTGRKISIHAPLTGSDPTDNLQSDTIWDFNPRSPYGERPY